MPLIDLLRPDQRAALKRLRKKIANRECMRRIRAADRDKMLCSGVDLPICSRTLRTTSPARRQARPVRAGCALRSVRLPVWCAPSVHGFGRFEDLDG
ncbi:MAG: hypothetical protein OXG04_04120, partial [Acidobacteria bacterium]|nr:hypothetical protein [Acidobacteriota bacterium]